MPIEYKATIAGETIAALEAIPLQQRLPVPTRTSWGTFEHVSILLVVVRTSSGVVGVGEGLARFAPQAHAEIVSRLFQPRLIGKPLAGISEHWHSMSRAVSGRPGGMLIEALAAVDIALWDALGKVVGLPISALLGGGSGGTVPVYAASVPWSNETEAITAMLRYADLGFDHAKVKIGGPPEAAVARIEALRHAAPDGLSLSADSNWAFTRAEAPRVADALAANGYIWFEEPLHPDDEDGYVNLAQVAGLPLAAGESNFTVAQARGLLTRGALGFLQPNVTRAGGITETWRAIQLAEAHGAAYAPHIGMSGIVCEAASLQLARAARNLAWVEAPATANLFKSELAVLRPMAERSADGRVAVPEAPGLGLEIDWSAVEAMRAE